MSPLYVELDCGGLLAVRLRKALGWVYGCSSGGPEIGVAHGRLQRGGTGAGEGAGGGGVNRRTEMLSRGC